MLCAYEDVFRETNTLWQNIWISRHFEFVLMHWMNFNYYFEFINQPLTPFPPFVNKIKVHYIYTLLWKLQVNQEIILHKFITWSKSSEVAYTCLHTYIGIKCGRNRYIAALETPSSSWPVMIYCTWQTQANGWFTTLCKWECVMLGDLWRGVEDGS